MIHLHFTPGFAFEAGATDWAFFSASSRRQMDTDLRYRVEAEFARRLPNGRYAQSVWVTFYLNKDAHAPKADYRNYKDPLHAALKRICESEVDPRSYEGEEF